MRSCTACHARPRCLTDAVKTRPKQRLITIDAPAWCSTKHEQKRRSRTDRSFCVQAATWTDELRSDVEAYFTARQISLQSDLPSCPQSVVRDSCRWMFDSWTCIQHKHFCQAIFIPGKRVPPGLLQKQHTEQRQQVSENVGHESRGCEEAPCSGIPDQACQLVEVLASCGPCRGIGR